MSTIQEQAKLILRNAFKNFQSKSVIFSNSENSSENLWFAVLDLLKKSKKILEHTHYGNHHGNEFQLVLPNTAWLYFLEIETEMENLCGVRGNFVYVEDTKNEKLLQTVVRPVLTVNFDPHKQVKQEKFEDELVDLRIFSESDRTKWPRGHLYNLETLEEII